MKNPEIKKWSVCVLYLVLLVLGLFLEGYIIFNTPIIFKSQNSDQQGIFTIIGEMGIMITFIYKSWIIILFVLLIGLLILHKKLPNLRLQLKVMMIVTFILELIAVYLYYS